MNCSLNTCSNENHTELYQACCILVEEVRVVFASVTTTEVRSYIRQKLSNAVKIMKKKEKTQGND